MYSDMSFNFVKASRDSKQSPNSLAGRKKQLIEAAKMVLASLKLLGATKESESRGFLARPMAISLRSKRFLELS